MNWLKTIGKFFKGALTGLVVSVAQNPSVITAPVSSEVLKDSVISLGTGILFGLMNWWKHRNDK